MLTADHVLAAAESWYPDRSPMELLAVLRAEQERFVPTWLSARATREELPAALVAELAAARERAEQIRQLGQRLRAAVPEARTVKGPALADRYPAGLARLMADVDVVVPDAGRPPDGGGGEQPADRRPAVLGPDEDVEELGPVLAGEVVGVPDHGGVAAEAGRADRAEDRDVVAGPVEQVGGHRMGLHRRRRRPGRPVADLQRPDQQVVDGVPVVRPVRPDLPAGGLRRRLRHGAGLDVLHQQSRPGRRDC